MKKNDLIEIKKMEITALLARVKKEKKELVDLLMDKNMNKLKDLKSLYKKRKNIAQILTVARQKELLKDLEGGQEKCLKI